MAPRANAAAARCRTQHPPAGQGRAKEPSRSGSAGATDAWLSIGGQRELPLQLRHHLSEHAWRSAAGGAGTAHPG